MYIHVHVFNQACTHLDDVLQTKEHALGEFSSSALEVRVDSGCPRGVLLVV